MNIPQADQEINDERGRQESAADIERGARAERPSRFDPQGRGVDAPRGWETLFGSGRAGFFGSPRRRHAPHHVALRDRTVPGASSSGL